MSANTYCGFLPGDGLSRLPLLDSSGEDYWANQPNADEIGDLINKYRNHAIFDAASLVDRELLNQNTSDLNRWLAEEIERTNNNVDNLTSGNTKFTTSNPTGLPSNYDDLLKTGAVFDATDPNKPLGLKRPTKFKNRPFQNLYPDLDDRLGLNPFITQAETQMFLRQQMFTPIAFKNSLQPGNVGLLTALNTFYGSGNFSKSSMGAFCALVPDIFAALNAAKDAFNDIKGFADQFKAFLADPLGTVWKLSEGAVKQMIEMLKNQVLTVVDQLAQQAMDKIRNTTGGFVDGNFLFNQGSLSEKFIREKEKIMNFFSKENMQNLKDKISGAISYAVGVFERCDLEEIQFLILRFCELIAMIEQLFFGRTAVLSEYQAAYSFARQSLSASGNLATARAIQAGAIRYNPDQRYSMQQQVAGMGSSGPMSNSPYAAPGATIPAEARALPAHISPITPEELGLVPSYEEIMQGNSFFHFPAGLGGMRAAGWTGAQTAEKVMLIRLSRAWGERLPINSVYRSPDYNASVGGAPNSVHKSGKAFDVAITSEGFINTARSIGFAGFGTYNSFTHIDTGTPRTWRG